MKSNKYIIIIFVFTLFSAFTNDTLPELFSTLLTRAKITFEKPKELIETPTIANDQMNYEYALINKSKNFEVRYAIRPLDSLLSNFEKDNQKGLNPNKLYNSFFQVTLLNISGGQFPQITQFDSESVKNEFNADWGGTAFVEVGKEFGQKYKYCMAVALHKNNIGDVYCFYLSNKKENILKNMDPVFHSLKFK